jgi:hypothetical protein
VSTVVVMNGRVVAASRDAWRRRHSAPAHLQPTTAELPVAQPTHEPVAEATWRDPVSGILYRRVARMNPTVGWVSARTILRWFTIAHEDLHRLWSARALDAAIEGETNLRRYRVLDVERCRALSNALRRERTRHEERAPIATRRQRR